MGIRAVNVEGKYNTKELWHDKNGKPLHPHTNYYVGGNTKFYGAALFRFRERDFGELQHYDSISPGWPISYQELEPYYTQAEHLYHVHGTRGEDLTAPWASAPYPHPAVSHEPRLQHLPEDFARQGCQPFHVPLGLKLQEKNPHSQCIRCATCDGYSCLVNAKSDAHTCAVKPALAYENVSLFTNAKVVKLETSASGREVSKVCVERDGSYEVYSAKAINERGHGDVSLWNEEGGFFYDLLHTQDGKLFPLKVRSMVGLIPLFAVEAIEPEVLDQLPNFKRRLEWFIEL